MKTWYAVLVVVRRQNRVMLSDVYDEVYSMYKSSNTLR